MIKTIFFDFDLTLVDSRKQARAAYDALCKVTGKIPSQEGFDNYVGQRLTKSLIEFSITKSKKEIKKLRGIFIKAFLENIKNVKTYGKDLLAYLKKRKISVIIVSNNAEIVIGAICKLNNMHFDKIVSDEQMKNGEEKYQAILRIIKKNKLKKQEAFYVGDHINDIIQARKAGIKIVSVTTGVYKKKDLIKYNPDFIISNLNKIKEIINKNA